MPEGADLTGTEVDGGAVVGTLTPASMLLCPVEEAPVADADSDVDGELVVVCVVAVSVAETDDVSDGDPVGLDGAETLCPVGDAVVGVAVAVALLDGGQNGLHDGDVVSVNVGVLDAVRLGGQLDVDSLVGGSVVDGVVVAGLVAGSVVDGVVECPVLDGLVVEGRLVGDVDWLALGVLVGVGLGV